MKFHQILLLTLNVVPSTLRTPIRLRMLHLRTCLLTRCVLPLSHYLLTIQNCSFPLRDCLLLLFKPFMSRCGLLLSHMCSMDLCNVASGTNNICWLARICWHIITCFCENLKNLFDGHVIVSCIAILNTMQSTQSLREQMTRIVKQLMLRPPHLNLLLAQSQGFFQTVNDLGKRIHETQNNRRLHNIHIGGVLLSACFNSCTK
mmetsp:Transcript_12504/g.19298  ORF Transcript_12504/g.19298 Transcript_12504/m.19298 type:complete len:203 (+) Transcript_12504:1445-2053(+)